MTAYSYGDKISYAIKKAGKKASQVAAYIGVSQPMMSKVINGRAEFSPENLQKLANYLDTPIDFFLKDDYIPIEEMKLNDKLKTILEDSNSADYIVLADNARKSDVSIEELEQAINFIIQLKKRDSR